MEQWRFIEREYDHVGTSALITCNSGSFVQGTFVW